MINTRLCTVQGLACSSDRLDRIMVPLEPCVPIARLPVKFSPFRVPDSTAGWCESSLVHHTPVYLLRSDFSECLK